MPRRTTSRSQTGNAEAQTAVEQRLESWQPVFESGDFTSSDRVVVALPPAWRGAADWERVLRDLGSSTLAKDRVTPAEVLAFRPTVLVSTPSLALRLVQAATAQRINLAASPIRLVVATGEPGGSIPATRRAIEQRWSALCLDVYALADYGVVGFGCFARAGGIHLRDADMTPRVFAPGSDRQLTDGELGELVLNAEGTRVRTGDLVRLTHPVCACGQSNTWAEGGVLGTIHEWLDVRGLGQLLPSTIEQIVRRHPAVVDFGLRVYERPNGSEVAVELETDEAIATEGDRARVAVEVGEDLKRSLGVRIACDVVAPGTLADDHAAGRRARKLSRQ